MRALVVYESMYGNTSRVAAAIARGLATSTDVVTLPVGQVGPDDVARADLVVVGGPTHAHGMSRPTTRKAAVDQAADPGAGLEVEEGAAATGVREWLGSLGRSDTLAAAFDTRVKAPAAFTGRASKGIGRELRKHGFRLVAEPESFLVTKDNHLEAGEEARAAGWGRSLVHDLAVAR